MAICRVAPCVLRCGLATLAIGFALAATSRSTWAQTVVYGNDFQSAVGPEWSSSTTEATPLPADGSRRFLGRFADATATLALAGLPAHSTVTVEFDLYIMSSWDGDIASPGSGPDIWTISLNGGPVLLRTTFSNFPSRPQDYPSFYDEVPGGATNQPKTGSSEQNTLGYPGFSNFPGGDSVYHLALTFPHGNPALALEFTGGPGLTSISDEGWGLDNLEVRIDGPTFTASPTPSPTPGPTPTPTGGPGSSQVNPLLPIGSLAECDVCPAGRIRDLCHRGITATLTPIWWFCGAFLPQWIDPELAAGYEYRLQSEGEFSGILDFPVGFSAPFSVILPPGQVYGPLGPGNSLAFAPGVRRFVVNGLDPLVDGSQPDAFPIKLASNPAEASFTVRPLTCPSVARLGCIEGWKKASLVVDERRPGKEKLLLRLGGGPEIQTSDLGDPLALGGTDYSVCAYDAAGLLAGSLSLTGAGRVCGGRPCWKALGAAADTRGYVYKDRDLASDGIGTIRLRSSRGVSPSSISLVAANQPAGAHQHFPGGITAALAGASEVEVQLVRRDGTQCFGATLDDVRRSDATFLRANLRP